MTKPWQRRYNGPAGVIRPSNSHGDSELRPWIAIFQPFMQRFNTLVRLRLPRPFPRSYANMSAPSAAETDTQAENVANTSGITTESLRKTITDKLEAKHVDIEDMSGTHSSPRSLLTCIVLTTTRRVWPDVSSHDRLTTLRQEEQSRTTSTGQFSLED